MQTNTQNTRMHFADRYTKYKHRIVEMHNTDKSKNTNTHDLNAKKEAPKSKKGKRACRARCGW